MKLRLFRYSGNKQKLLPLYKTTPERAKRIVEPYLGSGAFIINSKLPGIGYETNGDIVAMWRWLQKSSEAELHDLNELFVRAKQKDEKPDIKEMKLDLGPQTYMRVNAASLVLGQLKSWKIYPQNTLPINETIACLPRLKDIEIIHGSANNYKHQDGDILFIDPPYTETDGGYEEKGVVDHTNVYSPSTTNQLISSTNNPIIFTYGTNAPTVFSNYNWEIVKTVKVPNMRAGGTVDRIEHVSYINW